MPRQTGLTALLASMCSSTLQVALAGTEFEADLDGKPAPPYTSVAVDAGAVLTVSKVRSCSLALSPDRGRELSRTPASDHSCNPCPLAQP